MGKRWAGVKPAFLATTLARREMGPFRTVAQCTELPPEGSHTLKYQHNYTKNTCTYTPKSQGPWAGWIIKSCS